MSFQSAPVIADGRALGDSWDELFRTVFQSAPVIADGRAGGTKTFSSPIAGFNPRPSSLTDEPVCGLQQGEGGEVSIRARHR